VIASLAGVVAAVGLDHVVLDVGGVGLRLHVTPGTAGSLGTGSAARLATSLVVREDSLTLYGFADDGERELFELVQTVSGVGPRLALAMLAVHAPAALRLAISAGDLVALTKIPGVGRKSAERLVLELRDKVGVAPAAPPAGDSGAAAPEASWRGQVAQALVGLGWNPRQAESALDAVAVDLGEHPEVATALRAALRVLGR
jgi:Holliday junction DNA helicase RuvA